MQSEKIAAKHIDISLRVKQIAARCIPHCQVYVATYTAGRAGQIHQRIEEKSGEKFWSIKAWTPSPRRRLKDPDVIVTDQDRVRFVVEVKWGAVQGFDGTDLVLDRDEWNKMRDLLTDTNLCRVRGPAVVDQRRYRSGEFTRTVEQFAEQTAEGAPAGGRQFLPARAARSRPPFGPTHRGSGVRQAESRRRSKTESPRLRRE